MSEPWALILEDDPDRIPGLAKMLEGAGIKYFRHAPSIGHFLAMLIVSGPEENPPAAILLDHDLEGVPFADPSGHNTGSEAVRFMVRNNMAHAYPVIVHSLNHVAGPQMAEDLRNNGGVASWIPGCWVDQEAINDARAIIGWALSGQPT